MPQEYGKRVWSGDRTTVAEAKAKYESDPEGELIPLAVVLYSFRDKKHCANELLALRPQIIEYAINYAKKPHNDDAPKTQADKADVLATHLEWMSRRSELSIEEQQETAYEARRMCQHGIHVLHVAREKPGHTLCLLWLTFARLCINEKQFSRAREYLTEVETSVVYIADANQQARVCRKLGFLYRKCHSFFHGLDWGIGACLVPKTPWAVRLKSIAALLGVDA